MALVLADRVKDTTTTTGTGTITLSGTAPSGFQNFSVIGNGNTTYYTISGGSEWEVGIGTYSSTGPTLARTTVLESSNSNSAVDFSAGTKDVFVTLPAERVGVLYTPVKTSNYTAKVQDGVQTNTSGGTFTVNLPASPAVGDQVVIVDSANSWATNNLTVGRNGSTIEGAASDLTCDISSVSVQFVYSGTTWDVYAQVGGASAGIISVAGGGTGATTAAGARTNLGAAAAGANTDITSLKQDVAVSASGTIAADTIGLRGLPQNSQTASYTLALSDAGKHISITTGGVIIPANGSVAFPVGTAISIYNNSGSNQTISITTDTLRQAGTANTGSRTLAQYGLATCVKVASTTWVISGAGLS